MLSISTLPFPRINAPFKSYTLPDDLMLIDNGNHARIIPKGDIIRLNQTKNFGFVVIDNKYPFQKIYKY